MTTRQEYKPDPSRPDYLFGQKDGALDTNQFLEALNTPGVRFSASDWKYGWPHKFYLHVPNKRPEDLLETGSESGPHVDGSDKGDVWYCFAHFHVACSCPKDHTTGYYRRVRLGVVPDFQVKWYARDLLLLEDKEFRAKLVARIHAVFQVEFLIGEKPGDLKFSSLIGASAQTLYGFIDKDRKPVYTSLK